MTDRDPFAFARPEPEAGSELFIQRSAPAGEAREPLAELANHYLDRRREFEDEEYTDQAAEAFNNSQADLLSRMEETPAAHLK